MEPRKLLIIECKQIVIHLIKSDTPATISSPTKFQFKKNIFHEKVIFKKLKSFLYKSINIDLVSVLFQRKTQRRSQDDLKLEFFFNSKKFFFI